MANGRPAKGPERFLTCGREKTALAAGGGRMKTEPEINMGLSYPINFAGSNTVRKKTTAPQQCKTSLDWNLIEHGFAVRRALIGVARTLRLRAHTQQ